MSSSPAVNDRLAVVTVDVHDGDSADDIRIAADLLGVEGIRATFFVPGAVLDASHPLAGALRELPRLRHEVGSHAHKHDWREIEALMRGRDTRELAFLETARAKFEDFYGFRPRAFRSPVWCRLNDLALDELVRLGYDVDSSATPQRVQMFTSRPLCRGWLLAPRSPHFIRAGLLEVPTASAVVAAGSTTFRLLRSRLSLLFVRLLLAEADLFSSRVVVLQFDSNDFNRHADREVRARWELSDCLLKRYGGFGFRRHLLERDRGAVTDTAWKVLRLLPPALTLSEVRRKIGGGGGS
jgi:hypothetical protein